MDGVTLLTDSLPSGLTGVLYETSLDSSLPHPPGIYLLAAGQLPTGLHLDQNSGQIFGYPHVVGTFRFDIEVRDGPDQGAPRDFTVGADRKSFTLVIGRGPTSFLPQTLPVAQYRAGYAYVFDVAGGTAPYFFQLAGGELPEGLAITPNGALAGFPTEARPTPFTFQVSVSDANLETDTESFQIRVIVLPLVIKTPSLPSAAQHFPYEAHLELASGGGGAPYTWSQVFPLLPTETDLDSIGMEVKASDGTIKVKSGFTGPSGVGTFEFRIQVIDEAGQVATRAYELTVNPGPVLTSISPNRASLPGPYTVNGLNFQPGATLTFAPGQPGELTFTPTFVDATKLTFAVAPLFAGGSVTVRVTNPDTGFGEKANAFLYAFQTLSFGTKGLIDNSTLSSTGLAAGDLDGDGLADILHAGSAGILTYTAPAGAPASTAGGLHYLHNQGNLVFAQTVLDGSSFFDVQIADVNVDGKPDVVALSATAVRVWINNPLGTLTPVAPSALPNDANFLHPSALAIGRFNSDAIPDILFSVSHFQNQSGRAYTMNGNGSGGFTVAGVANGTLTNTYGCMDVVAVDLNADQRHEAVVVGGFCNSVGPVFRYSFCNGDGTFGSFTNSANASGTGFGTNMAIATGNFLGNGTPAVVTTHTEDPGDGGQRELKLWSGSNLATGWTPALVAPGSATAPTGALKTVVAGDFDLDLSTDFAVGWNPNTTSTGTPTTNGSVNVFKGSTKLSVQQLDLTTGSPSVSVARTGPLATGDLDGDGKDDLLACTSYWAYDYQPHHFSVSFSLRLAGNGSPMGIVYYLNTSN